MPSPRFSEVSSVSRVKRTGVCIAFVLVIFVLGTVIVYNHIRKDEVVHQKIVIPEWEKSEDMPLIDRSNRRKPTSAPTAKNSKYVYQKCNDTNWCMPMPKKSYFRFDPPRDAARWKKASLQALSGEQVLLKRTIATFPNFLDFLDGDISFRKWNNAADVFIDKRSNLDFLKKPLPSQKQRRLGEEFDWEKQGLPVIPQPYNTHEVDRAPVLKMGYFAFQKTKNNYFEGPQVGEAILSLREFLNKWKEVKNEIQTPFIVFHGSNENWGWLSTIFPNRTIDWGSCCDDEKADLMDFLNHDKTLMLMVEQHSNVTHPKLVTFPRGLPLTNEHTNRLVWDTMRQAERSPAMKKNQLVFTASSKWGARPRIIECVSKKFKPGEFQGLGYDDSQAGRMAPKEYYKRLVQSRTGLALSGLGADTFRLWELMTLGSMAVIERGMGLDKMVWRLPALIVDDFDQVTPELLRVAYVEALYRADEWQYEKLAQSFWFSFIANVSSTKSVQTVLDRFPAKADETGFTRPLVQFDCWKTNSCGKGTMRIPASSC